jgi:hypothetical protein
MSLDPIIIDPVELGLSRLATQYSESTNLKKYLSALLFGLKDLEQAVNDIALRRTIDEAYGFTLDQIGELVGQPRLVLDTADNPFFGFWDGVTTNEYLGFGDNTNLSIGGVFYGDGASDLVNKIDDNEYRTYIRARIARNISRGRASDMLYAFKFILGDATIVNIQDTLPSGNVTIGINRTINDAEQTLLTVSNLSPIPAGVGIQQWYTYIPGIVFGFSDALTGYVPTGAAGFADGATLAPTGSLPPQLWTPKSTSFSSPSPIKWIKPVTENGYVYLPSNTSAVNVASLGIIEPNWNAPMPIYDVGGFPEWKKNTVYIPAPNYGYAVTINSSGLFCAVGASVCATSPDGITWTARTIPAGTYYAVTINSSGLFCAVGDSSVCATSPDGITWTARTIPAGDYYGVTVNTSGLFCAVGSGVCATSPDGITWTARTIPVGSYRSVTINSSGLFCAVGINVCATSPDGINWTARTIPVGSYYGVTVNSSGLFCAVSLGSRCATSPDGINWTARTIPVGSYYGVTVNSSGLFCAVGSSVCATSPDGITWTARTIPAGNYRSVTVDSSGFFCAVGVGSVGSVVSTSPDGITWTDRSTTPTGTDYNDTLRPSNGNSERCYKRSIAGTSGPNEPVWPSGDYATVVDGSVTWLAIPVIKYTTRAVDPRGGGIFASGFE